MEGGKAGISLCWRLALCKVPRGTVQLYGRIRTSTDSNGQVRTINLLEYCDKPYHHKPRRQRAAPGCRALPLVWLDRKSISRASGTTHPNNRSPVGRQPNDRRPASGQGTISHSRTGFASEKRGEWTWVLDPSGERRKARPGKARLRRILEKKQKKMARETGLEPATSTVTGWHSNQLSYSPAFIERR